MSCNCGSHDDKTLATGLRRFVPLIMGVTVVGALIAGAVQKKGANTKDVSDKALPTAVMQTNPASARVQWIGEMHKAIHEGDTKGKVRLASLLAAPGLNAIGPVEGLRGEITVIDGAVVIGVVEAGKITTAQPSDTEAAFLVWAHVAEWVRRPLPDNIRTEAEIEAFLPEAAKAAGIPVDAPFAFRIEGRAELMAIHIVWQEPGTEPGKETHDRSKVATTLTNTPFDVVGFWSDAHRGIFTPGTSDIHMHMATPDRSITGHVDAVSFAPGAILLLPSHSGGWKRGSH